MSSCPLLPLSFFICDGCLLRYFMAASSALKRDIRKLGMGLQVITVFVENRRRIGGRGRRGRCGILLHA